ncbi:hypothetical protein [Nonomuraea sp. NPDC005650]|uniref:hypothetical protein n=1 Tax=Nonomuraea sp. NPDC005650 TaxID=3157045 RepID=UPI0033A22397
MSTPHQDGEALIPRPPLTTAALRAAVAQIAPAYLGQFVDHLDQATEQAARQSTVAPLQNFLQQWGEFVAIQRHPAWAARLQALEQKSPLLPTEPSWSRPWPKSARSRHPRAERPSVSDAWTWEYNPDTEHVIAGLPPTVILEVERLADQLAVLGRDATRAGRGPLHGEVFERLICSAAVDSSTSLSRSICALC